MTTKRQKTLHRFAAVAVVLLTLCLVFMMPVGAAVEENCLGNCQHVAAIGNTHYDTLQEAVGDVTTTTQTEIELLKTVTGPGVVIGKGTSYLCNCEKNTLGHPENCGQPITISNDQDIIIDFNGYTYTAEYGIGSAGTSSMAFQLKQGSTVVLRNGTISSNSDYKVKRLIQNYADLTLEGITLDGTNLPVGYVANTNSQEVALSLVLSNNCGTVVIDSTTIYEATSDEHTAGTAAFDVCDYYNSGVSVTVNGNSNIVGDVICESTGDTSLTINGGTFTDPTVLNYLGENAENVMVNLAEDVNLNEKIILTQGSATLDLDGYTLDFRDGSNTSCIKLDGGSLVITSAKSDGKVVGESFGIWVAHGKLVVSDDVEVVGETKGTNSVAYSAIYIEGSSEIVDSDYSEVEIQSGSKVTGAGWAVAVNKAGYGVKLTVGGELSGGISINGMVTPTTGKVPAITISETGVITSNDGPAIYAAGYGIWTIADGAELTGNEALSIKSGKFTISGGKFTATGTNLVPPTGNDNGPEKTGAALSITSNDDYAGEIEVTVNGGEFISKNGHAVYEGIAKNTDGELEATASMVNSISISAGSFASAAETDVIRIDEATTKSVVSGGIFNKEVGAGYIADGKFSVVNIDDGKETYPYAVGDKKYAFSVDNAEIGFDSVKVGYTQPAAKEVTITNKGNTPFTLKATENDAYIITIPSDAELEYGESAKITIQPKEGLAVGNYAGTIYVNTDTESNPFFEVSFLVYQPSSGGSSKPVEEPEEPVVEPEVPTEEPEAGEATVETEVTDGGEVELETPTAGGSAAADEDEAKITGVVLPTGTDSEVTFVPVSEQAAPAGKETQTKKVFEINVPTYEKGKAAVIKFTMTVAELAADGKEAADVALWHFDEETGEWTKLVTSYTIVDGIVYFEAITNDFSPFAIVYEDEPVDEPVDEPETPASPAPVLAVLAGLGAAVVLRRK